MPSRTGAPPINNPVSDGGHTLTVGQLAMLVKYLAAFQFDGIMVKDAPLKLS